MPTRSVVSVGLAHRWRARKNRKRQERCIDERWKGVRRCEDVGAVGKDSNRIWRNGRKKRLDLLTQICIPEASGAERDGVCFPLFPVGLWKSTDFLFSLCSAPL